MTFGSMIVQDRMNWRNVAVLSAAALLSFGCAPYRVGQPGNSVASEFVGSTPCAALVRDFLKIPSNAACECIRWQPNSKLLQVMAPFGYSKQTTTSCFSSGRTAG